MRLWYRWRGVRSRLSTGSFLLADVEQGSFRVVWQAGGNAVVAVHFRIAVMTTIRKLATSGNNGRSKTGAKPPISFSTLTFFCPQFLQQSAARSASFKPCGADWDGEFPLSRLHHRHSLLTSTSRTARCGPACRVVGQGEQETAPLCRSIKLALAGVGEGPKDRAGVLVHDLTKVHGDGEQEDQKEKVDAKQ